MSDWKFGTIVQFGGDTSRVMVVGQVTDPRKGFVADDTYTISEGRWFGITISTPVEDGAWGNVGGTTWMPDDWKDAVVVDE